MLADRERALPKCRRYSNSRLRPAGRAIIENPCRRLPEPLDDESFFGKRSRACDTPSQRNRPSRIPPRPADDSARSSTKMPKSSLCLSDLVSGPALLFDITESDDDTSQGYTASVSTRASCRHASTRRVLAVQAHFDMHGMIQGAAQDALEEFIVASVRKGVAHGAGRARTGVA